MKKKSLVIFSGGQDSTVCLYSELARAHGNPSLVHAIHFTYGQRHKVETYHANCIASSLNIPFTIVDLPFMEHIAVSGLLEKDSDICEKHSSNEELPASFVPNRNMLFLTIAHTFAQRINADRIVIGANAVDYSGYPDCRPAFILGAEHILKASSKRIKIYAPLILKNKAEIFELADELGCLDVVLEQSHTCYNGDHKTKNAWGFGCGTCPACVLRKKGWNEYKATQSGTE